LHFLEYEYEIKFKFKSNKSFNHEIWSSFKPGSLVQNQLKGSQSVEFQKLNKYSQELISEKFNNFKTTLKNILKTWNGFIIYRYNLSNRWIINININNNQIEIKEKI
jgi:hypothetical protein